ncbi:hypothetical protein PR202_gb05606 [Eleusine coracana subsp. coracana]|uniref:Kinesin motor domain-containing protein n=1 Tax=Eleusine coracana subsp. coracana TaxID=191504 RepID=A0AAV5E7Q8_ELECO|nr:hypothetical protein PR202_gb05606 [Eleusine coracana subsp. coracana]
MNNLKVRKLWSRSSSGARGARTSVSASPTVVAWAQPKGPTHPTVATQSLLPDLKHEAVHPPSVTIRRLSRRASFLNSPLLQETNASFRSFLSASLHPDQETQTPSSPEICRNSRLPPSNFFDSVCWFEPFAGIRPGFSRKARPSWFLGSLEELLQGGSCPSRRRRHGRGGPGPGHGGAGAGPGAHNHHHGLKEKLRALTLDYEEHKKRVAASQGGAAARQHRHSVRCLKAEEVANDENSAEADGEGANRRHHDAFAAVLRENVAPPQAQAPSKNNHVVPFVRPKEPQEKENVVLRPGNVMSCPIKKTVVVLPAASMLPAPAARKLSLGGAVGGKVKAVGEAVAGNAEAAESRIRVFVRLRPMSRKEKEAKSKSCVKIVNNKDVYLTEFASENDYLRLKRVRGRHFCFDSAFPDSTTQADVYSTS